MSAASESARAAAKSKVERLTRADPHARVDASGYAPEGALNGDVQTGPRVISRRQFRRGGTVEGTKGPMRADRKPRASGGRTKVDGGLINEDIKQANEEREGTKHVGGMKAGGRAHKLAGGPLTEATGSPPLPPTTVGRKEGGRVHTAGCQCAKCGGGRVGHAKGGVSVAQGGTRPVAGRLARKGGGRTKGKTNVNIIITQPGAGGPPMPPPGAMAPPPGAGPVGLHQGVPPPAPPMAAGMPMGRKSGGRTENQGTKLGKYPLETGSGGGLGRLEKAKAYG